MNTLDIRHNSPTRWILTGGSGFIGTNFLQTSKAEDGDIVVLDRRKPLWLVIKPWIRYIEQDTREIDSFRHELIPGSVVIHMASVSYPGKAEKMIESDIQDNVLGTVRLAQACVDQGVGAFIFLSSGGAIYGDQSISPINENAYPQPKSAYGVMKLTNEHYLRIINQLRGMPVALLRVANPFGRWHSGAGQGAINVFLKKILLGEPLEVWGSGTQVRDYIPVQDVIEAMRLIGRSFRNGCEAFNIGSGDGRSLNDVLEAIKIATNISPTVSFSSARNVDVETNILNIQKMQTWFNWKPTTLFQTALRDTWDWVRSTNES